MSYVSDEYCLLSINLVYPNLFVVFCGPPWPIVLDELVEDRIQAQHGLPNGELIELLVLLRVGQTLGALIKRKGQSGILEGSIIFAVFGASETHIALPKVQNLVPLLVCEFGLPVLGVVALCNCESSESGRIGVPDPIAKIALEVRSEVGGKVVWFPFAHDVVEVVFLHVEVHDVFEDGLGFLVNLIKYSHLVSFSVRR